MKEIGFLGTEANPIRLIHLFANFAISH